MSPVLILVIGLATVVTLILALRINAFIALFMAALVVSLLAPGNPDLKVVRVAEAFGVACGKMGIVIALAAIIGTAMMESGGADRIVLSFTRALGAKRGSTVLMGSGFTLGIPASFDTVFYLLVPIARSFHRRTGKNYVRALLAIATGGIITHTLVPPGPGPLAVANTLGVNLGVMILMGGAVGAVSAIVGLTYSTYLSNRYKIPFRLEEGEVDASATEERGDTEQRLGPGDRASIPAFEGPPLWLSLLPVLLPVLLIGVRTVFEQVARGNPSLAKASTVPMLLGDPNVALLISAGISLYLVYRQRGTRVADMQSIVETSLKSAGIIILITAAGSAFGEMLKEAQLSVAMKAMLGESSSTGHALLIIGFATSAILKFAQGSTTSALIVTSAILAAMIGANPLSYHPVYLALAVGGGGLVGSWMNDSSFWIFAKVGGLSEAETLRTWTPLLAVIGTTTFLLSFALAAVLPMR
ncbi:MAG: SLC13 family permease [Deltaproteobacteria bacterium]|nr:SLC13 family permease [Deltaproteobacteria bacterium]